MDLLARALAALTPLRAAALACALAFATIAGAWIFEAAGYLPCDLCLKQRWVYYAGVPLAALATLAASFHARAATAALLVLLALIFAGGAVFGAYHAGVEWGFWQGPQGCTGAIDRPASMDDFLKQLQTVKVVRCDEVALRILGLSLAGWNAVISACVVGLAALGARRAMAR
mgnify:CR=1 FL=1|jgi:disulfide bond formation protein DsbB